MKATGSAADALNAEVREKVEWVITSLNRLVTETEEKYAYVYDFLPEIERDVNLSIREVEILLNYLIYNRHSSVGSDQSVITETLLGILDEFEEVTASFLNEELVAVLFRTFLNTSNDDQLRFSELIKVAREVEETLTVLRDLALNSIIFSAKIGEEGATFQILSDRINQFSKDLGLDFSVLNKTIDNLHEWNESFQKDLKEFIKYEEDLATKFKNGFKMEFDHITATLKASCAILADNLEHTAEVFGEVGEMMVMIQNQDIIRQNIENLVKVLRVLQEKSASYDPALVEQNLDYIVFANRIMDLSQTLINNIEVSLNDSLFGLTQKLNVMNGKMSELEEDAFYLNKLFIGGGAVSGAGSVLGDVFHNVLGQVSELMNIQKQIENKTNLLMTARERFIDLIAKVDNDFMAINKEAKKLKKMKILIRIELARINAGKSFTLESIVVAIDQVIDTINQNQRMFNKLSDHFLKNIDEFNSALNLTKGKLESSAKTLEKSEHKLNITSKLATGAVAASHQEMGEIFSKVRQPRQQLADTVILRDLLISVKTAIAETQQQAAKIQELTFAEHGVTQWEEKEDDLRLLMEQFTCFVERKAMSNLTGALDLDIGSDSSGDVVLF